MRVQVLASVPELSACLRPCVPRVSSCVLSVQRTLARHKRCLSNEASGSWSYKVQLCHCPHTCFPGMVNVQAGAGAPLNMIHRWMHRYAILPATYSDYMMYLGGLHVIPSHLSVSFQLRPFACRICPKKRAVRCAGTASYMLCIAHTDPDTQNMHPAKHASTTPKLQILNIKDIIRPSTCMRRTVKCSTGLLNVVQMCLMQDFADCSPQSLFTLDLDARWRDHSFPLSDGMAAHGSFLS